MYSSIFTTNYPLGCFRVIGGKLEKWRGRWWWRSKGELHYPGFWLRFTPWLYLRSSLTKFVITWPNSPSHCTRYSRIHWSITSRNWFNTSTLSQHSLMVICARVWSVVGHIIIVLYLYRNCGTVWSSFLAMQRSTSHLPHVGRSASGLTSHRIFLFLSVDLLSHSSIRCTKSKERESKEWEKKQEARGG